MNNENFSKNMSKLFHNLVTSISMVRDNAVENFGNDSTTKLLFHLEEICGIMYEAHNNEEREAILPHLKSNSKDKLIEMYLDSAEQTMEAVNRLEWLLGRLEAISDRNVVAKILEDYEARLEK